MIWKTYNDVFISNKVITCMDSRLEYLIKKSNKKHGDKYDYSFCTQTEYKLIKNKIICPKHGEMFRSWDYHINSPSGGCSICKGKRPRRNKEQWVEHANTIHNNKYDYSITNFMLDSMELNKIICPTHGEWSTTLDNHTNKKSGCPKCSGFKWGKDEFVRKAHETHGMKYEYSEVVFISQLEKVKIICPIHGTFNQTPHHHINQKQGCFECGRKEASHKTSKSISEIEENMRKIHFSDYEYDFDSYVLGNTLSKIKIICPKHGAFYQQINNHCQGQGCPNCKRSIGELKIRKYLIDNNIEYIQQKRFTNCKNKSLLSFDFYIPNINTCIEFDGEQHFKPCRKFGGIKSFDKIKVNDSIKNTFCIDNKINLVRIPFNKVNEIENILCNLI